MSNLHGSYDPDAARRSRRQKQAAVGAVGLAAVLGGGAFLVTEAVTRDSGAPPPEALAPRPTATSVGISATPSKTAASRPPAVSVSRTPSPSASARTKTAAERVAAARSAAAKDGVKVQRPLPAGTPAGAVQDLTGYRELSWVADGGDPVGSARCSQTFRFASNAKPAHKPNLLVCWRTSAAKSVYTVMVDMDGRPSKQDSVAALSKRWTAMD
jgi:hypothetical protein